MITRLNLYLQDIQLFKIYWEFKHKLIIKIRPKKMKQGSNEKWQVLKDQTQKAETFNLESI